MTDPEYLAAFEAEVERKLLASEGSLMPLSPLERIFAIRFAFQCEVNNGGFHTFFYNYSGDHAQETAEVLRTIAAPQAAQLLQEAIALFGNAGPSQDILERRQQMKQLSDAKDRRLDELTSEYFGLEHQGLDTADLLDAYLLHQRQSVQQPNSTPGE